MIIKWYNKNKTEKMYVNIQPYGINLSDGVTKHLCDKVVIGIDKINKVIAIKSSDNNGYTINHSKNNAHRMNAKSIMKILHESGVEFKKYEAVWDGENEMILINY